MITKPEQWLGNPAVEEILSVSECLSKSLLDHTSLWLHNAWFLYDSLEVLQRALDRTGTAASASVRRFCYEVHEDLLDDAWIPLSGTPPGAARPSPGFVLRGYDVVCLMSGADGPQCSPLSCNSEARRFDVNKYCLLASLEQAIEVAQRIDLDGACEPGPYGIMSVWEASS
ncbi:MAG TPA: hypothetical protein VF384_06860 [Planctomycetota bacterium]